MRRTKESFLAQQTVLIRWQKWNVTTNLGMEWTKFGDVHYEIKNNWQTGRLSSRLRSNVPSHGYKKVTDILILHYLIARNKLKKRTLIIYKIKLEQKIDVLSKIYRSLQNLTLKNSHRKLKGAARSIYNNIKSW